MGVLGQLAQAIPLVFQLLCHAGGEPLAQVVPVQVVGGTQLFQLRLELLGRGPLAQGSDKRPQGGAFVEAMGALQLPPAGGIQLLEPQLQRFEQASAADRRQLTWIPQQQQAGLAGQGLQQRFHQGTIHHRQLIQHQGVHRQGPLAVAPKLSAPRGLQPAVQGARRQRWLKARQGLPQPGGGFTGGGGEQHPPVTFLLQ